MLMWSSDSELRDVWLTVMVGELGGLDALAAACLEGPQVLAACGSVRAAGACCWCWCWCW